MKKIRLNASVSAAVLALGMAVTSGAVYAQDQEEGAAEDTIVVTGSRIMRDPNLTAPAPVQSVGAEDVTLSGDVNIADVVNDLPALIGSNTTASNSGGQGTLGAATLNLRNLGTNRTLVLVDGRRHVAGQAGTSAVDVNTIPSALVERVEVLSGGASAVYGADAVTGVVNFILKDDFEGTETRAQFNISDDGDAERFTWQTTIGENFDNDRGNFTISLAYESIEGLLAGEREHTRGDRVASDWPNPQRFLQQADIDAYGIDQIRLGDEISGLCGTGVLGGGDAALCARIQGIPARSILPYPRFNLSSYDALIGVDWFGWTFLADYPNDPNSGLNFGADGVIFDFNNNGVDDCLETINGTQLQRFGGYAGCHVGGNVGGPARVFQDGLIAGTQNAFGGDGTGSGRDLRSINPDDERFTLNFTTRYDFSPGVRWFLDAKFSMSETITNGSQGVGGFYDSWVLEWDNPYIPQNLRQAITTFVNDNPGYTNLQDVNILIGRDVTDLGRALTRNNRQTIRFVTGFEGDIGNTAFSYEVSANYGRTSSDSKAEGQVVQDRFYAAADAVVDPATGNIVCRTTIDPTTPPIGSFLSSAGYWNGYKTFSPGAASGCQPVNLFGVGAPNQAAIDWITTTTKRERTIEQTVFSAVMFGDSSDFFELPAGPIGLAFGAEYRKEESEFIPDSLESPNGASSTESYIFPVNAPVNPVSGSFDVTEVFAEFSAPLLIGQPLAEELILEGAYRYSDYSTLGGAESWNLRSTWAPFESLRFRGTISQTVRAPNINELFSPLTSTTSRPLDPCDVGNINNGSPNRAANCAADGIPAGFTDPLTARVAGFTGGNPNLDVETADTTTMGFIFEPSFIPGLSITADYYTIEIQDAIAAVGFQEILEACYDASSFPNQFCSQFTRDRTAGSPTFLGLAGFTSSQLNFAAVETEGWDYQIAYTFDFGDLSDSLADWGTMSLSAIGNHTEKLDRFEDPTDSSIVNNQLYELGQPQETYVLNARWQLDRLTLNWQSSYWGEFLELTPRIEIETADNFENAWTGEMWRHDVSGIYDLNDNVRLYGGINNVTEESPIISSVRYPVGLVGREFFFGFSVNTDSIMGRLPFGG